MNWTNIYYVVLACIILVGIAITVYLWLNQRRLDRQGREIRQNARTGFENAAVKAEDAGLHTEAKLARALRDMWR